MEALDERVCRLSEIRKHMPLQVGDLCYTSSCHTTGVVQGERSHRCRPLLPCELHAGRLRDSFRDSRGLLGLAYVGEILYQYTAVTSSHCSLQRHSEKSTV